MTSATGHRGLAAEAPLDFVIVGARLMDPAREHSRIGTLGIRDGRIAAVAGASASLRARRVVRADGLLLTPGLVDLHTHVFAGQDLGAPVEGMLASGVTTVIDAGSAGADLFGAFRLIAAASPVRIRALLNVASIGATSIMRAGELSTAAYLDEQACIASVAAHRGEIVGIKIRASHNVGPGHIPSAFESALRIADTVGLPLMVHIGPSPMRLDDVCRSLRPGDIVTHCFSGSADPVLADVERVLPAAVDARARGVLFDLGHGNAGFCTEVARHALRHGFGPDTISTDLHAYSRKSARSLPTVMAKMVALGLDLDAAVRSATLAPARAVGLDAEGIGSLRVGAPADLVLFNVERGARTFTDTAGHSFLGQLAMHAVAVWRDGVQIAGHPR